MADTPIPVGSGARIILVSREVRSQEELQAMTWPTKSDWHYFVVWDMDKPLDVATLSLGAILRRYGVECDGRPEDWVP